MADLMEQRLRALELLQSADEPLAPFDMGSLAAIERSSPTLVARVDAVRRIEASRARKRAARKPVRRRRGEPSVFDRQPVDDDDRVLP